MHRSHPTTRPHPTNDGRYRPTPPVSKAREATPGELMCYQTGTSRFPHLGSLGGFHTWPLEHLYEGVTLTGNAFNCMAWAVGHTDRWIDPGTVAEMEDLFRDYHFQICSPNEAEVELYRILNAPLMLRNSRGQEYPNQDAKAQHAHRRDNPRLDSPPYRGCSSKLADGPLIAHNRGGLQDHRSFGSGNPQISYGSVYQYWRRTPEHPSFPGKEHNLVPSTGHYPDDPIFAFGYGKRPPGHPGNDLGLPRFNDSGRLIPASGDERARKSGGFFSRDAQKLDKLSRPSATPALAGPSTSSRRGFAQVPRTRPHDPIPAPSKSAADWAVQVYKGILRSHPKFVKDFEKKFYAWQRVWHSPKLGAVSRAEDRCYTKEFGELMKLGSKITPLVVYKLLDRNNFTAVYLYNALEENKKFKIDPRDVTNFLVLQRQNNLVIDLNYKRKW